MAVRCVCADRVHRFNPYVFNGSRQSVFAAKERDNLSAQAVRAGVYFFGHAGQMAAALSIALPFISHSVHVTSAESTALLCYLFGLHTIFLSLKQDRISKPRSISRRIAELLFRAVLFSGSAVLIVFTEWHLLALIGILFLSFAFIRGWKKTASLSAFEAEVTEEKKAGLRLPGL